MDRKRLEMLFAYAERAREQVTGQKATYSKWLVEQGLTPFDTVPAVERTPRPDWLQDGSVITRDGFPHTVLIGSERLCLLGDGTPAEPFAVDTSTLLAKWRPFVPAARDYGTVASL